MRRGEAVGTRRPPRFFWRWPRDDRSVAFCPRSRGPLEGWRNRAPRPRPRGEGRAGVAESLRFAEQRSLIHPHERSQLTVFFRLQQVGLLALEQFAEASILGLGHLRIGRFQSFLIGPVLRIRFAEIPERFKGVLE